MKITKKSAAKLHEETIMFLLIQNPPSKKNENLLRVTCFTVAGERGRILKNRGKKTAPMFFTSQLATRNSQPSPPGSKKVGGGFRLSRESSFFSSGINSSLITISLFSIYNFTAIPRMVKNGTGKVNIRAYKRLRRRVGGSKIQPLQSALKNQK
jgi:hypothetical protein